jgi:hypothetical protein
MTDNPNWDAFISHAAEDKEAFVRPLAVALQSLGAGIWYDEVSLRLGDSLSKSIDQGLAQSRYGIVVLSQAFIGKAWPDYELRGLIAREIASVRVVLPLWHGVTRDGVLRFSPTLADKLALNTEGRSAVDVAIALLREIRPDLYEKHPRAELAKLADGSALRGLQEELDRVREDLEHTKEQLQEYRCPFCDAAISSTGQAPVDDEQKHWDTYTSFECGHETFGGFTQSPCPSDPKFPALHDYDLQFHESRGATYVQWICSVFPKTKMARQLHIMDGVGSTREEAEQRLRDNYARRSKKWGTQ